MLEIKYIKMQRIHHKNQKDAALEYQEECLKMLKVKVGLYIEHMNNVG